MDVVLLSRIQFALTVSFHYLFPPMTIGLGWALIILEGLYVKTKKEKYKLMVQFWSRIFALFFAMGVVTGFVMVFAFGNNWSAFSKFVGSVFGSMLAAEGIFAFFLEAGFMGIMLFGWNRVSPGFHYLSTVLVAFGATFSATWIVMANSWMQTPAGYKIIGEGDRMRAVVTDIWAAYFNPSFLQRLTHVLLGCGLAGVFLLISVSAYYLIRRRHLEFARFTLKYSFIAAFVLLLLQLWSADSTARGVAKHQPVKLAAMEGVFETESPTAFTVVGMVDMEKERVVGLKIPGLLSILSYHSLEAVPGLKTYPLEDWPNVPGTFICYHLMIYAWGAMMLCALLGLIWRNHLEKRMWFLWYCVISVAFPYTANTCGWFVAELGRQPWVVQGLFRTMQGHSKVLHAGDVLGTIIMFIIVYVFIGALFVFLLNRKIHHGPTRDDDEVTYREPQQLPGESV